MVLYWASGLTFTGFSEVNLAGQAYAGEIILGSQASIQGYSEGCSVSQLKWSGDVHVTSDGSTPSESGADKQWLCGRCQSVHGAHDFAFLKQECGQLTWSGIRVIENLRLLLSESVLKQTRP